MRIIQYRFDRSVTEVLRAPYVRYVDDFAQFHDDPGVLAEWRENIARFLDGRRLRLHPGKTVILSCGTAADFLGFTLAAQGLRRLADGDIQRFRNRLRGLRDRWRMGAADAGQV